MRISERQQRISIAQTELEIKLHRYAERRDLDHTEMLRAVLLEAREITLDMQPPVKRADKFSDMKDVIKAHQTEHEMTDIEVLQALMSHCEGILKYMLRYERHGDYETPAGWEPVI